jgi:hypothetical protein
VHRRRKCTEQNRIITINASTSQHYHNILTVRHKHQSTQYGDDGNDCTAADHIRATYTPLRRRPKMF